MEAENYSLERQLFSYQKSIAYATTKSTAVDDPPDVEYGPEGEEYRSQKGEYVTRDYGSRDYPYNYSALPERSFSTDTAVGGIGR